MIKHVKQKIHNLLRWSEKYTKTDMVYLASGGFWLTLNQAVATLSGILLAIAFANLLPRETYGNYRYILSLISILAIPTLSGINTAVIRAVARGREACFIPALKTKLIWSLIGSLASLGLAEYYLIIENRTLAISFLIVALFLPLMYPFMLYGALWKGRKRFDRNTKYNIVIQVLSTSALVATLLLTKNLFLILLVYFLSFTILRLFFLIFSLKKQPLNKKSDPKAISYGKHLSLIGVFHTIANQAAPIVLWHSMGASSLAIYSFAILVPQQLKNLFTNVFPIALPKFSEQKKSEIKATLLKKIIKLYFVLIPLIILYLFLAPFIYKVFFPQYLDSIFYSQIFSLTIIFIPQTLLGIYFQAQKQKKTLYILSIFSPVMTITALLIFVPIWGLGGAVIASLVSQSVGFALQIFLFKKT